MNNILENIYKSELTFYNQYDSFPGLPTLGSRLCGASAVGMATKTEPIEVVRRAMNIQKIPQEWGSMSVAYHPSNVRDKGIYFIIPIGEIDSPATLEIAKEISLNTYQREHLELFESTGLKNSSYSDSETRKKYSPVLSLGRGLDWRGFSHLANELGFIGAKIGDINSDKVPLGEILEYLKAGHKVLSSVKHNEDSSHVVLVDATRKIPFFQDELRVLDPLEHAVKWVKATDWWNNSFNGYGGVIYKK